MKFVSVVLLLLTFDGAYGMKSDAVELECSKHDNGLREPDPVSDNSQTDQPETTDDITATPVSDNDPTRMEKVDHFAESVFDYVQFAARVSSQNLVLANITLRILRKGVRKVLYDSGLTIADATITVPLEALRKSLAAMIKNSTLMNETFAAIADPSVTYEGLKGKLLEKAQQTAADKIEESDKALQVLTLIYQGSDAFVRLRQSEYIQQQLSSLGKLRKMFNYAAAGLSAISDWGHRWVTPKTSGEEIADDEKAPDDDDDLIKDLEKDEGLDEDDDDDEDKD